MQYCIFLVQYHGVKRGLLSTMMRGNGQTQLLNHMILIQLLEKQTVTSKINEHGTSLLELCIDIGVSELYMGNNIHMIYITMNFELKRACS